MTQPTDPTATSVITSDEQGYIRVLKVVTVLEAAAAVAKAKQDWTLRQEQAKAAWDRAFEARSAARQAECAYLDAQTELMRVIESDLGEPGVAPERPMNAAAACA